MSTEMHRIRLVPFNKAKGALARRFCVGGQLFVEGRWYVVSAQAAAMLEPLTQSTGCPYFQCVVGDAAWTSIVRRELAEAVGGPGAAALAELAMAPPAPSVPPKAEGETRKSRFQGLRAAEIDDATTAQAALRDVVSPAPAPPPVEAPVETTAPATEEQAPDKPKEPVGLDTMNKGQLVRLAAKHGIQLDKRTLRTDMIETLRAEVFETA